jgi:hypothetical protein
LQEVTLPASLTAIGYGLYGAFESCGQLMKVICHNPIPPACSSSYTFSGTPTTKEL